MPESLFLLYFLQLEWLLIIRDGINFIIGLTEIIYEIGTMRFKMNTLDVTAFDLMLHSLMNWLNLIILLIMFRINLNSNF